MPFRIDLATIQYPKIWTSDSTTDAARQLQQLYDNKDVEGYRNLLMELKATYAKEKGNEHGELHSFRLTDNIIYEIWDKGQTSPVSIQFMVKGSVIIWSFNAEKDITHQSWRDKVFNTAAIAHQSVTHGCETYYRGSDAYHLKKMHIHSGESNCNHNHYRLSEDRPITPREVEEHLRAFFNQTNGKEFIPSNEEIESIIGKYKTYWAEHELDPRYSSYYPIVDNHKKNKFFDELITAENTQQQEEALKNYCKIIEVPKEIVENGYKALKAATQNLGTMRPIHQKQLKICLEKFAHSEFKNYDEALFYAKQCNLFFDKAHAQFILAFNEFVSKVNFYQAFKTTKNYDWLQVPSDNEISETDEYQPYAQVQIRGTHSKSSVNSSGSIRDQYSNDIEQIMTWDDEVEYKLFAEALTNRCRSIDNAMLGELTPEDFRKALRLYHAMKHLNNGNILGETSTRFSKELFEKIVSMKSEIAGMVDVDSEPSLALEPIFNWLNTASPELEKWLCWVEKNGSRGLGSELASIRHQKGSRITRCNFFKELDDRTPGSDIATVFALKPKSNCAEDLLDFKVRKYIQSIMHLMGQEIYKKKSEIAILLLDAIADENSYDELENTLENCNFLTDDIENSCATGCLTELIQETRELKKSKSLENFF